MTTDLTRLLADHLIDVTNPFGDKGTEGAAAKRMHAALVAVHALHKPDPYSDPEKPSCDHCLDVVGEDQPSHPDGCAWPCPTVQAITAALTTKEPS